MSVKGTMFKKAFSGVNGFTNVAMPIYAGVSTFNHSREEGNGLLESGVRAGFDYALGEALGMKYIPWALAQAAPSLAVSGYQAVDRMSREVASQNMNTPFMNSRFGDTQQAYTMRQHGMQLAKNSRYNLEHSLMGNEASHFKY